MKALLAALALAAAPVALVAGAASGGRERAAPRYGFVRIGSGFRDPVYVTSAPGDAGTLYVVEQEGTIRIVRGGRAVGTFLDIRDRVLASGEDGLLSMAFSPSYERNHLFYVDYTDLNGDTRVVELRSEGGVGVPASARELLFVDQPYPNHNGGQLQFDRDGYLYVGMGDGGTQPNNVTGDPQNHAQDPASRLGKLLRIDPARPGATWQTVGYGLRNPWRFSFDRLTGDLWIGDVGAATWEEVDFRPSGLVATPADYGWSRYEGRASYNRSVALLPGVPVVWPAWAYAHDHLHATGSCSVTGGYVYRGTRVRAARGRYLFGDLCSGSVWGFRAGPRGRASRPVRLRGRVPMLTSFGEDAGGELYAVGLRGGLYALRARR